MPTRRKGGQHAYFDDGEPRPNSTWAARGCSGDVRGGSGYLILHADGPEILVEALARRVEGERPWPRDLFELVGLAPFRVRGPVEALGRVDTAAALNRSALIELPLEQIQVGARHPALWDQCRFWAYRQSKGTSLVNWKARVFAYALRQNDRFPRPFSLSEINDEVARLAWSIAAWTWDGHGPIDHGPEAQRRRGIAGAKVKRYHSRPSCTKKLFVVSMAARVNGRCARALGVSRWTVQTARARLARARRAPKGVCMGGGGLST